MLIFSHYQNNTSIKAGATSSIVSKCEMNADWPPCRITEAMNRRQETFVKLDKPIPVIISYYTARVDEKGILNFQDGISINNKEIGKKIFTSF